MSNEKEKTITASEAFKLFDKGLSPMQVVQKTDARPDTIQHWYGCYVEMTRLWLKWKELHKKTWKKKALTRLEDIEAQT